MLLREALLPRPGGATTGVAGPRSWARLAAPGALLLALAAYLYGLGAPDIPGIGDEPLYLQIARVTGASGRWLPLVAERGILDTKPPLLFWTGLVATAGGAEWSLWRLRLPMVALTFLSAALVGWLAARLSRQARLGWLAALLFLGFRATVQHGRPFLTNGGETLFLLLPLVLVHAFRRTGPALTLACGLALGAAALVKSFFLVVPGTAALALFLWRRDGAAALRRRHAPFLLGAAALGLGAFLLWPLLDPRPELILSQFVLGENAGKFEPGRFLEGLLSGPYPLWRIWLGPLLNAGLLAPPLLALALDTWRRRHALPDEEAALWWWVFGFLVVYSLPTQRQENYLLPAGAALAALLALRWEALPAGWVRAPLALLGLAALALPLALLALGQAAGAPLHPAWVSLSALAMGAAALFGAWSAPAARRLLPLLTVLALPLVTAVMAPFERALPPEAAARLSGLVVEAPDRFAEDQELLRFRLPGAALRRYPCPRGPVACPPPEGRGVPALAYLDLGAAAPPGWRLVAEVPHLKMRHSPAEVTRLLSGELGLLVERLALLEPAP
jgi:4-amino-4-deoxy-L-arabinose transferase-like glycosyltransferase